MSHKKISVVVLGSGDSLKKALITNILGKDLSKLSKRNVLKETEIYENDTYEFICTPDLNTECEDIRELFADRHPDMSLMVVEDGFSKEEVLKQIERLKKTTGKPTEEFRVVLPLSYKLPFNFYTTEHVFSKLSKLAEERHLMSTSNRHAESDMSTQHTLMELTDAASANLPSVLPSPNQLSAEGEEGEQQLQSIELMMENASLWGIEIHTKVNLVLLGLAGTGKSASGNTILGKELFMSRISSTPITTECQEAETQIGGTHVRVIDTPDIFDDDIESSVKNKHVTKCKQLCQSGTCVYLLVMQVSRFTHGERDILRKLKKAFGSRVQEQTVILFTHGEDLCRDKISLEEFLLSCQPDLKKIVEKCDNRCVVFENSATDSYQVEQLMQTVDRMLYK